MTQRIRVGPPTLKKLQPLLKLDNHHWLIALAIDYALIGFAVFLTLGVSWWLYPISLVIIGSTPARLRQPSARKLARHPGGEQGDQNVIAGTVLSGWVDRPSAGRLPAEPRRVPPSLLREAGGRSGHPVPPRPWPLRPERKPPTVSDQERRGGPARLPGAGLPALSLGATGSASGDREVTLPMPLSAAAERRLFFVILGDSGRGADPSRAVGGVSAVLGGAVLHHLRGDRLAGGTVGAFPLAGQRNRQTADDAQPVRLGDRAVPVRPARRRLSPRPPRHADDPDLEPRKGEIASCARTPSTGGGTTPGAVSSPATGPARRRC